jgi:hypothetical protein
MPDIPRALLFFPLLAMSANLLLAQSPASPPQPGPESRQLAAFLGTWRDEAVFQPSPISPGGRMTLTQTCDWFSGGFSLVCHTDTSGFMGDIKTLTIITYDPEAKHYTHFELNSVGYAETAVGTYNAGVWTFVRESKTAGKTFKIRSSIKLPTVDSALMTSELSVDGGPWSPIMELKGNRIKQSAAAFDGPAQRLLDKPVTALSRGIATELKPPLLLHQ